MSSSVIFTLSALFTVAAIVLLYIFVIPKEKREGLNKLGVILHDFLNFKYLILEHIMKFFYVLATVFVVILGFFMLFYVEESYHYGGWYSDGYYTSEWKGYYGLLILILGPIVIRILYEAIMMAILAVKNIIEINNKIPEKNGKSNEDAASETPMENTDNPKYCASCGAHLDENGTCPYCMKKY